MKLGGRAAAAIEVLEDIYARKRPATEALKDWGTSHRFAGSGDRAAIGNIVFDALRLKAHSNWIFETDSARAQVMGALLMDWGMSRQDLVTAFDGDKFAPAPLSDTESHQVTTRNLEEAPDVIKSGLPEWTVDYFQNNFDEAWIEEAQGFLRRAPLDVRVNTLKANLASVEKSLQKYNVRRAPIARQGLRFNAPKGAGRLPNIQSDKAYLTGKIEIQDAASQVAADLVFAQSGEQILDFCAGAGGKALALAAAMENKGQIHAFDEDPKRLAPLVERSKRAGIRNIQIHQGSEEILSGLMGKMDRVIVDAPCTGSGTWRRRPDAKWRLSEAQLNTRIEEQNDALVRAAPYVRPGGYLVYVTCSVFPQENEERVNDFLTDNPAFEILSVGEVWQDLFGFEQQKPWSQDFNSITMTPGSTDTDGFFVAVMGRVMPF